MSSGEALSGKGYAAFTHRDFRLHCAARLLFGIALSMQTVAVGWYVYSVTKSPLALGLSGLSSFLPAALLALYTGHVADNYNRRIVLALSFCGCVVSSTGLLILVSLGSDDMMLIYSCIIIGGASRAFTNPTAQALTPNLVPREHFANAITWYTSVWQSSRIVGPALGGLLYIFGPPIPFLIVAVSFATGAALIMAMRTNTKPQGGRGPISWATLSAGIHFILSRKVILGAISLDLVAVLFAGATALMPVVAQDILHVGPWGLGLLRASPALGAIAMGAWLAHMPIMRGAGKKMLMAVGVYGFATICFGLSDQMWLCMAALFVVGAADQISVVVRHTMVQSETPDEMRGRVAAVNSIFISGSSDLGEFESGITAAWWGTVPAIIFGGAMTMSFAALWAVIFPQLRDRDQLMGK